VVRAGGWDALLGNLTGRSSVAGTLPPGHGGPPRGAGGARRGEKRQCEEM
jgi:hypothetical protein